MCTPIIDRPHFSIKTPVHLSPRIQWLRDFYFQGANRPWTNEFTSWSTGTPWDHQFEELTFYVVPETYTFFPTFRSSFQQAARVVPTPANFFSWSIAERRAWFNREVVVNYLPQEILPGDLLAGARFNLVTSACLTEAEAREHNRLIYGKDGSREAALWFHNHGYGNAGATSAHIIPDYARVVREGWLAVFNDLEERITRFSTDQQCSPAAAQLRAMRTAAEMPHQLAERYSQLCADLAAEEEDPLRREELRQMSANLDQVPWQPARTFWEGVQSLWLTHMLVMSDENFPGAGLSFGRLDQYLYPLWQKSLDDGMDREFGKEILKCFWIHCNTAYDAMIRTGNQGITAGYGQLFNISGMGPDGSDLTNDLTYALLEVIDEMSPILEPKPNVRLHRGSPQKLLDTVVGMVSGSQGAPFLLNFDERSMAGLLREARKAGVEELIHPGNVWDYASVGCLENTMQGNDLSGTVDANLNLYKAVEHTLTGGMDLHPFMDALTGKAEPVRRDGADTGDPRTFQSWDQFWQAYCIQTRAIVARITALYERSESIRAAYKPTPYLSCLVRGCAGSGRDVTQGGSQLKFVTIEGVTFATTVDSLLAVKYLVYDAKICSMDQLIGALRDNWEGHAVLQAQAAYKAPKYGRDDDAADEMARQVMELWTEETWKHRTLSTGRQFRPGMLSWNYWIADSFILPASPDGRPQGKFLSNALCPSNGADINGPTANTNSVGKSLGGRHPDGDYLDYINYLPNGGSHTITFSPSMLRDPEHKAKFRAFLQGYIENGGTALQINLIDADMLRDAQVHPEDYRHLLVRVTGYNAYFTSIGRELQDEIIAREAHSM